MDCKNFDGSGFSKEIHKSTPKEKFQPKIDHDFNSIYLSIYLNNQNNEYMRNNMRCDYKLINIFDSMILLYIFIHTRGIPKPSALNVLSIVKILFNYI